MANNNDQPTAVAEPEAATLGNRDLRYDASRWHMGEEVDLFGNTVPPEKIYLLPHGETITASALRAADGATQRTAMKAWFFERFEDPIDLPYDGEEGDYQ